MSAVARGSAVLLILICVAGLAAPWISPFDPNAQLLERRLEPPSREHWLGLDELGRDIASRLLFGARISLLVGLMVTLLSASTGALLGGLAGFAGGKVDFLLMRAVDIFMAFPGILLAIALVAVLGPALQHLVLALVLIGWVGYARLVRAQVLALVERPFVLAAKASGLPSRTVVLRHLAPHILPALLVQTSLGIAGAILAEASLSFLVLGAPPPQASWGAMINAGRLHLLDAPHVALFPGLAIALTVLSLNFLGDALTDRQARIGQ